MCVEEPSAAVTGRIICLVTVAITSQHFCISVSGRLYVHNDEDGRFLTDEDLGKVDGQFLHAGWWL